MFPKKKKKNALEPKNLSNGWINFHLENFYSFFNTLLCLWRNSSHLWSFAKTEFITFSLLLLLTWFISFFVIITKHVK